MSKPITTVGNQRISSTFTSEKLADGKLTPEAKPEGGKPKSEPPRMKERKKTEISTSQLLPKILATEVIPGANYTAARTAAAMPPITLLSTQPPDTPRSLALPKTLNIVSRGQAKDDAITSSGSSRRGKEVDSSRHRHINSSELSFPSSPHTEKNQEPTTPRSSTIQKLKRNVSKKFHNVQLNLSSVSEKISKATQSPAASPIITGRSSSSKNTPRKKLNNTLRDVPVHVRNQAAKAYLELEKNPAFAQAGKTRKGILLHAKMISVLADHQIDFDSTKVKALLADAEIRSKNLIVDQYIDLEENEFSEFYKKSADAAFIKPWANDASDIKGSDGVPMGDVTKAKPTFIRDFKNSTYQIKEKDGSIKKLKSIDEFLSFIGPGKHGNLGMVVSNIASQNLGMFMKHALFSRQDKDERFQSILKLSDGTPIRPLANFKATYVLSKDSQGNVIINYQADYKKEEGRSLRAAKMQASLEHVAVGDDAKMQITATITIAPDGEWSISNPHVYAEFWNNPVEE